MARHLHFHGVGDSFVEDAVKQFWSVVALIVVAGSVAQAQWERIEMNDKGGNRNRQEKETGAPHPLKYFLTPSAERDSSDTLLVGVAAGRGGITWDDYRIEVTQHELGKAFGRRAIEIDSKFWTKQGTALDKLFHGDSSDEPASSQPPEVAPAVEWKSIVLESSPGMFRELYLIVDDGIFLRPLQPARLLNLHGRQVLATSDAMEGNGGYCTEGYWVLRADGPWLLDFAPVRKAIARIVPANAQAPQIGCWAMSIEKETISAPVQEKNAECHACGWMGYAEVTFRIEGHSAVPVTAKFEPGLE